MALYSLIVLKCRQDVLSHFTQYSHTTFNVCNVISISNATDQCGKRDQNISMS